MLYHCEAHCQFCFVTFQVYLVAEKAYLLVTFVTFASHLCDIFVTFASHLCDITGNSGKVHLSVFLLQTHLSVVLMVFQVSISCGTKGSFVNLLTMKAHLSVVLMVFQVSISCGSKGSFVSLLCNISSTFNLMLWKLIFYIYFF